MGALTGTTSWVWLLAAGVGLFLFGMGMLGDALAQGAGQRTRHWLAGLSQRPWYALVLGMAVTALLQSSSVVSVIVLGLVHGGVMPLAVAAAVIMGANIGTTLTAQIIALPLEGLALPLLALAVPLYLLGRRHPLAAAPVGFGLLLLGLNLIGAATAPLAAHPVLPQLLDKVASRPTAGLLLGFVVTTALDSSSGALALMQRMADASLIPVAGALPFIYGTNVGTTTATLAAAYTLNRPARQAAYFHVLFNVLGVVCLWPLLWVLPHWLPGLSAEPAQQLAHAHTLFNGLATLLFMPFRRQLLAWAQRLG